MWHFISEGILQGRVFSGRDFSTVRTPLHGIPRLLLIITLLQAIAGALGSNGRRTQNDVPAVSLCQREKNRLFKLLFTSYL